MEENNSVAPQAFQNEPMSCTRNTAAIPSLRDRKAQSRRIVQNFLLVWLDTDINELDEEFQSALTQLQTIVNSIFSFTDSDQCIAFLQNVKEEKVFMIISVDLSQRIVPLIHTITQLDSIFVFGPNKLQSGEIRDDWMKVRGAFADIPSVCDALKKVAEQCDNNSVTLSFLSASEKSDPLDQNQLDPTFMYTQLLKEALLEINFDSQSVKELSNFCREQYHANTQELTKINEFEHNYQSQTPIWWYTSDFCLHRMLNRALRVFEIDTILKMGFFLADIHRQIEQLYRKQSLHCLASFKVYRGQGLSKNEFKKLMQAGSGLISFNNFLSTSKDRNVSLEFARSVLQKPNCVGVLFINTVDSKESSIPFALLHKISYYQDSEQEILFSMHTVFRIAEIQKLEDPSQCLWEVKLTLTSDHDPNLVVLTEKMREATEGATGWHRLGQLLIIVGAFDKAEDLYMALIETTAPMHDREKGHVYHMLGMIKIAQGYYRAAVSFYEKTLQVQEQILSPNDANLASTYNNLGSAYEKMDEFSKALSFQEKALKIRQRILPPNHPDLASSFNNIGMIYAKMGEYSKALSFYKKDLDISERSLPSNHPDLGTSYNNIALVYNRIGQYAQALSFYEKALHISQQSLPSNHPDLAATYNNIGAVYYQMEEFSKAISFYERALQISQQALSPYHPNLAIAYSNIAYVCYQMGDCARALLSYEKVLDIKQRSLPANHPDLAATNDLIGRVYARMSNYTKAVSFYERALEIAQHSLPANHPELKLYRSNLECVKNRL